MSHSSIVLLWMIYGGPHPVVRRILVVACLDSERWEEDFNSPVLYAREIQDQRKIITAGAPAAV
jgi:hypothetical protein